MRPLTFIVSSISYDTLKASLQTNYICFAFRRNQRSFLNRQKIALLDKTNVHLACLLYSFRTRWVGGAAGVSTKAAVHCGGDEGSGR